MLRASNSPPALSYRTRPSTIEQSYFIYVILPGAHCALFYFRHFRYRQFGMLVTTNMD